MVGSARKEGDGPGPQKSLAKLPCMSGACGLERQGHQKSFSETKAVALEVHGGCSCDLKASPMPETVPLAISQG